MSDEALLADTNRLLQELLKIEHERSENSRNSLATIEAMRTDREQKQAERMKAALIERGVPEEEASISEEDWDIRQKLIQAKSRENMAKMTERNQQYQEELLAELRIQSDLLRQISEKLQR